MTLDDMRLLERELQLLPLRTRLEALTPLVAQQREKRKAERAAKVEEARSAKTKIATEAETIAAGDGVVEFTPR